MSVARAAGVFRLSTDGADEDDAQVLPDAKYIITAETPPRDRRSLVFCAMVMIGAGFLFPFNSYVAVVDFMHQRYAEYSPDFYIPMVYMYVTAGTTISNLFFGVGHYRLENRIRFGYVMFASSLVSVYAIEESRLGGHIDNDTAFWLMLLTVVVVALGSGVQQSSVYGFVAMLPPRYTSAVMLGESVAGVAVSFNRIVTKNAYSTSEDDVKQATYVFFGLSIAFITLCAVLYELVNAGSFSKHYVKRYSAPMKHGRSDSGDVNSIVLTDMSSGGADDDGSKPEPEPEAPTTAKEQRRQVTAVIRTPMMAVALSFTVTLMMFPGVATEVESDWGDWMPTWMIAAFNVGDLLGKLLPFVPIRALRHTAWLPRSLLLFTVARLVYIPLLTLTVAPTSGDPYIPGKGWPLFFVATLGVTGGYTGTTAMTMGSAMVSPKLRETAGAVMTLALLAGLTLGTTLSIPFSGLANTTDIDGTHPYTPG